MLEIGQSLSHYSIVEKIGKGGMGEVFRAKDQKLGREVAIKVLPEEFARDPDRIAGKSAAGTAALPGILKIALQIAEALEAAHDKGVIHRDLKPANIKVTPEGKVKVLDFGLAKAYASEQAELSLSNSPTLSDAATRQGVILGTAAYMSPEQARGKAVDKRTDIWAFGCVLYEMLTGRVAFRG